MVMEPDCIFCKIVAGEIPCFKVAESEHCIAILDAFPATRGHVLVVTKEHRSDMLEMTAAELSDAVQLMARVGAAAESAFGCPGINFLNNLGEIAGQKVMHAHFHVLPRYEDDSIDTIGMTFSELDLSDDEKETIRIAIAAGL